jgi:multimeric flavodoxin WrbA
VKVLGVSTTTHAYGDSASGVMLDAVLRVAASRGHAVTILDAAKLHVVHNLSCYAGGGRNCASPDAGPYRCWAHKNSVEDPDAYGGVDEMPVLYDGITDADVVVWATSVRWMSHSSLLQKLIERMNTLENRASVYGEANPLTGKRAGVLVAGQHYEGQKVAICLQEVFIRLGFTVPLDAQMVWQRTLDLTVEQGDGSNRPHVAAHLVSPSGRGQISRYLQALGL